MASIPKAFPPMIGASEFLDLNPQWLVARENNPAFFSPNHFYRPVRVDLDGVVITGVTLQGYNICDGGPVHVSWQDLVSFWFYL